MIAFFVLCTITLISLVYILKKILQRKQITDHINKIPGPPTNPIIGNVLDLLQSPDKLWQVARRYAKEHYPIYKLWGFHISCVNILTADDVEILLSSTTNIVKGPIVYKPLHNWLASGLLTSKGKQWQKRRKTLTPAFHFNILTQFLKVFITETDVLVKKLIEESCKPWTNVVPLISESALKSITETAMGTKLHMDDTVQQEYINSVYRIGRVVCDRICRPWLELDFIYNLSSLRRKEKKLLQTLHGFTKSVIHKRIQESKTSSSIDYLENEGYGLRRNMAMLDLLIKAMIEDGAIDENGIREEVDTFTFEAHDTTSASICYTLMLLACHKDIQNKVREEIRDIFGDTVRSPTYQELQQLQYMEMVIKESLRMYPSVPIISRTLTEPVTTKTGYYIPENTEVVIHIQDVHNDERNWPNPKVFDPDRFLPDNTKFRHPFAYVPFSAGPRNCIGQKFAMLEMKTVLTGILRNFVLLAVDTPETIVQIADIVNRTRDGIKIKFERLY